VLSLKPVKYSAQLAVKLEPKTRRVVEELAERAKISLGEATRELLNAGIVAKGIEC
jgi:hypothetical protein